MSKTTKRSLHGPWSRLASRKRAPAAVPRSNASTTDPIIVESVESWEDLDNGTTFLALPHNKDPEHNSSDEEQEETWDNDASTVSGNFNPMHLNARLPSPPKAPTTTTTTTTTNPRRPPPTYDFTNELAQYHTLSTSRPMLLINAKVARAENSKSLSQSALREIQVQLQDALADDFEVRVEQLFRSGVCFHTDSSNHGKRLEQDRSVLQALYPGEKFVSIEYPQPYVGEDKMEESTKHQENKAVLWENVTQPSSSRAITMLTACIRECHHTMEWKSAMRSEINRLGIKQIDIMEARTMKEMELIRKCDEASTNLNAATAAVIQYHDGFALSMNKSGGTGDTNGEGGEGRKEGQEGNESGGSGGGRADRAGRAGRAGSSERETNVKCTTLADAQKKVISSKLASTAADLEFNKFEKRQRRRDRRLERRRAEAQARKEAHPQQQSDGKDGTNENQHRKMTLLDQIIAVVFDGIPLGQRIPVEVGGEVNHINASSRLTHPSIATATTTTTANSSSSSSNTTTTTTNNLSMKEMLAQHFQCLLRAQLRLRHQWIVDFGYVPLHEFDRGVESGTDSDSEGDEVEERKNRVAQQERDAMNGVFGQEEEEVYNSDSGSDGWRRRQGEMGGALNWDDDDEGYDEEDVGYDDDEITTNYQGSARGGGGGGGGGTNTNTSATGDATVGFHVIQTPSFLRG